jgi:hypothetical protein
MRIGWFVLALQVMRKLNKALYLGTKLSTSGFSKKRNDHKIARFAYDFFMPQGNRIYLIDAIEAVIYVAVKIEKNAMPCASTSLSLTISPPLPVFHRFVMISLSTLWNRHFFICPQSGFVTISSVHFPGYILKKNVA